MLIKKVHFYFKICEINSMLICSHHFYLHTHCVDRMTDSQMLTLKADCTSHVPAWDINTNGS